MPTPGGGYDGIFATDLVQQVSCWAHARHKFFEARTVQPAEAHAALAYIVRLYERGLTAQKPDDFRTNPTARREWFALRHHWRQGRSVPILKDFRAWLSLARPGVLPKSPVGQAISHVCLRAAAVGWLRAVLRRRPLLIDNNVSERTLRPCAIGRKNWLFAEHNAAGRTAAVLYSLVASAKRNEVEPWAHAAGRNRDPCPAVARGGDAAVPDEDLAPLLPNVWLAAHHDAHHRYSR